MPQRGRRKARLVFISHSSIDTWVAKQIATHIEQCGAQAFLDEATIEVGADFEEEIRDFLSRADELVVLITPWALDRKYIWAELGAAWGRGLPIVALLHGLVPSELQNTAGIPNFLKKRDMIVLNDLESYLKQLARRAKRRL